MRPTESEHNTRGQPERARPRTIPAVAGRMNRESRQGPPGNRRGKKPWFRLWSACADECILRGLSKSATKALLALADEANEWQAEITASEVAWRIGVSRSQACRALAELTELGLLTRDSRLGRPTIFRLVDPSTPRSSKGAPAALSATGSGTEECALDATVEASPGASTAPGPSASSATDNIERDRKNNNRPCVAAGSTGEGLNCSVGKPSGVTSGQSDDERADTSIGMLKNEGFSHTAAARVAAAADHNPEIVRTAIRNADHAETNGTLRSRKGFITKAVEERWELHEELSRADSEKRYASDRNPSESAPRGPEGTLTIGQDMPGSFAPERWAWAQGELVRLETQDRTRFEELRDHALGRLIPAWRETVVEKYGNKPDPEQCIPLKAQMTAILLDEAPSAPPNGYAPEANEGETQECDPERTATRVETQLGGNDGGSASLKGPAEAPRQGQTTAQELRSAYR